MSNRVLLLSWEYPPVIEGGLARHVRKLAEALVRQGVAVDVLTRGLADRAHVVVHLLHPRDEAVQLARPTGLAHAVNAHATGPSRARPPVLLTAGEAAGEHVHFHALADKRFSELANVSREPALDHGRVLPREEQHAVAHWCTLPRWTVAPHDPRGSEIIA